MNVHNVLICKGRAKIVSLEVIRVEVLRKPRFYNPKAHCLQALVVYDLPQTVALLGLPETLKPKQSVRGLQYRRVEDTRGACICMRCT